MNNRFGLVLLLIGLCVILPACSGSGAPNAPDLTDPGFTQGRAVNNSGGTPAFPV